MIKNILYTVKKIPVLLLFFSACEETIDISDYEENPPIVVEGYIEDEHYPIVFLGSGSAFFKDIDSVTLYEMIVSRAKVTIYSETDSEILTLRRDNKLYPPFYYEGTELKGKAGETYRLIAEYENRTVTGKTTIPPPIPIDSVWIEYEGTDKNTGVLRISFTDPAGQINYYRTYTKRKGKDDSYIPTSINTFNGQYNEGEKMEISLYRGMGSFSDLSEEDRYFHQGDTIMLKLCTIDKESFRFWNAIQGRVLGTTSFSPSGENVPTNIKNGLGVFSGMGSYYKTILAK